MASFIADVFYASPSIMADVASRTAIPPKYPITWLSVLSSTSDALLDFTWSFNVSCPS
jgi:hypothetical protein